MIKYFIGVLLILMLVACVPSWSKASDSLWLRIDALQKVILEQGQLSRKSKELWRQNFHTDQLIKAYIERDKLVLQYIKN